MLKMRRGDCAGMIRTPAGTIVQPGDFAAVRVHGTVGRLIRLGEILNGDGFRDYEHAIFYAGGPADLILEAEPGGAQLRPFHYDPADVLWSTDNPRLALWAWQQAQALPIARKYRDVPYSFADYAALAAHRLHLPAPGLRDFVADSRHMICSQMVDQCRRDLGSHLFVNPPRWNGYVTPADLANLILGR